MNIVLTSDLNLEILNEFSHAELNEFLNTLPKAIDDLNELIVLAIENNDIVKEAEYKINLSFAKDNKNKIEACLINKEADIKVETEFSTIFLN